MAVSDLYQIVVGTHGSSAAKYVYLTCIQRVSYVYPKIHKIRLKYAIIRVLRENYPKSEGKHPPILRATPSAHSPEQKKVGAQSENGKSWAPGTPRLARLVCMASSDPLPAPDAKSPAFPNDFFSHELERLPALAGACAR